MLGNDPSDLFFPSNIVVVEGRSDKIFLESVLNLLKRKKIIQEKKIVFHFVGGIDKARMGAVAVTEMLKTQAYIPVYRDKICGLLDAPNNEASSNMIKSIIDFFDDDGSRFMVLKKEAIEYYYPVSIVMKIVEKTLTPEQFEEGTKLFLAQVASNKATHTGNYFGKEIDKANLAHQVARQITNMADLDLIDHQITKLLRHSATLAF